MIIILFKATEMGFYRIKYLKLNGVQTILYGFSTWYYVVAHRVYIMQTYFIRDS